MKSFYNSDYFQRQSTVERVCQQLPIYKLPLVANPSNDNLQPLLAFGSTVEFFKNSSQCDAVRAAHLFDTSKLEIFTNHVGFHYCRPGFVAQYPVPPHVCQKELDAVNDFGDIG